MVGLNRKHFNRVNGCIGSEGMAAKREESVPCRDGVSPLGPLGVSSEIDLELSPRKLLTLWSISASPWSAKRDVRCKDLSLVPCT